MERSSRVFFFVVSALIAGSVVMTYYRFFVARDYLVQAQVDCDPYTEVCFAYVCDPLVEEGCTGDPLADTSYYKLIDRLARNVPLCGVDEESCTLPPCAALEVGCSYTLCDTETVGDGETCTDPGMYEEEHPRVEESSDTETDTTSDESTPDEGDQTATSTENDS